MLTWSLCANKRSVHSKKDHPQSPEVSSKFHFGANEVRAHAHVRVRADVVATKLGIIGANVVRAHARFPCEGRRSGH